MSEHEKAEQARKGLVDSIKGTSKEIVGAVTGKHALGERTDRPEGTVDEDANPPLTDPTKTQSEINSSARHPICGATV
jgi:hypothetical protein